MRSIAATSLVNDYELSETSAAAPVGGTFAGQASSSLSARLPNFDYTGEAAAAARIAGRINAANVPKAEHEALLLERQLLLDKKFSGAISKREVNRLEYVRWQLDRIEDSQHGFAADMIEDSVRRYEKLSIDLNDLSEKLEQLAKEKR